MDAAEPSPAKRTATLGDELAPREGWPAGAGATKSWMAINASSIADTIAASVRNGTVQVELRSTIDRQPRVPNSRGIGGIEGQVKSKCVVH
jgi:hypothetical protein